MHQANSSVCENINKKCTQKGTKLLSSFAFFTFEAQGIDNVSIKLKIEKEAFHHFWCADLLKSQRKHVLFCSGWEISGAALYQTNSYKWIAWYPIKKVNLPAVVVGNTGSIRKQLTSTCHGGSPDKQPSAGRAVIFLKSGKYQGNERRGAAPEQHPGDTEWLSL